MDDENTNGSGRPEYGRRLLPHLIDEISTRDPGREAFSIPRSSNPKDGWKAVTFKEYSDAINRAAHRIIEVCGRPPAGAFPTIAYIGPNDARYVVLLLGAVKAGYKALFISPRNSQEGQLSLFEKTDCNTLAFPKSYRAIVRPWLQQRDMNTIEVASIEEWFSEQAVESFPYEKSFEQAQWEPLVVLHTSGSTGIPKPIVGTHGMLAIGDSHHHLSNFHGAVPWLRSFAESSQRTLLTMPLFHAGGLYLFAFSMYWDYRIAFAASDRPLSTDLVVEYLENANVGGVILPPAVLEEMSQSDEYIEPLAQLNVVAFGGGSLNRDAGNRLAKKGVRLYNLIGSTESIPYPIYAQKTPELWQYFIINSDLFGADWRRVPGDDEVYRLVAVRKDKHPGLQGIFYTFPDLNEYDTNDLFKPHPRLPDHWIHYGRSDNIIVFSNGEKLNPVTIEEIVGDHPSVKGALVVGSNRFQPGLLIEPLEAPANDQEADKLLDSIWPCIVRANEVTVSHGQIARQFVKLINTDKPFLRAGKGTVQRALTLKLYDAEIDKLYEEASALFSLRPPQIDASSEDALRESIEDTFRTRIGAKSLIGQDTDFFSAGIDSLQIINASKLLRSGLEASGIKIDSSALTARALYRNPTPRRLARYIYSLREGALSLPEGDEQNQIQMMKGLWEKYTRSLPAKKEGRGDPSDNDQTIILTGSTGMLGSYILDLLVRSPVVRKVICFNRSEDGGASRQATAVKERGLSGDYGSKAEFFHTDMSLPGFGLPRGVYDRLLEEADRVIHNAWPVNFNIPVESFEPHLGGVRNIADFAAKSSKRVAVAFVSSIDTANNWDSTRGPVPEERLEDCSLPGMGYGRSKMIGSLILEDLSERADFPTAIIRVGQIAGPESTAGCWNKHEWLPSIIASSLYLGALPSHLGSMDRVDWTPAERIASLVLEVAGVSQRIDPDDISGYYHGVNPFATTWADLAPAVQEFYGKDRIQELISFGDWVDRLEKSRAEGTEVLHKNPGVKLIDSYRTMANAHQAGKSSVVFDMKRTTQRSPTMKSVRGVTPDLMKHWCRQWSY
ncbi:acetyl-CoA synthetase-like protein [Durotheca rogersii]|uniref:acetyl-CoA synthetase-like protein n=1 Tax=Durotheca rogersii TaxID=419775 RepID=UPI00221EE366|nr:acetyl-CoA synthetase-like protein [Durotheca rogersii]KAI5856766.1 acetyl-CoA synthetase-like protein [Durotheca rogersii]